MWEGIRHQMINSQRWIPRCWSLDVTCDYNQHREIGENKGEIKNYTFIFKWLQCTGKMFIIIVDGISSAQGWFV